MLDQNIYDCQGSMNNDGQTSFLLLVEARSRDILATMTVPVIQLIPKFRATKSPEQSIILNIGYNSIPH